MKQNWLCLLDQLSRQLGECLTNKDNAEQLLHDNMRAVDGLEALCPGYLDS